SHQLELVERLCDDVVIIDRGRVVAAGDADEVRHARTRRRLALAVEPASAEADGDALLADVLAVPGVALRSRDGDRLLLDLTDDADDQAVLAAALRHGRLRELAPVRPTLAEIFREVVR